MSITQSSYPRDVQDFQFKNFCRLRVFQKQGTYKNAVSLVAAASKFGLIFVGCPNGFQVITSSSMQELASASGGNTEITNYPRREIVLGSQPSHLNVSCDQNRLVVATTKDGCANAVVYNIASFLSKDIVVESQVRLSTKTDTEVMDLVWNPGIPNILAACLSDGSMAAYDFKPSSIDMSTLPPATKATCFCWSPKGKQLVVGTDNGTLTQYKPDLKAVKSLASPSLGSGSVALVNVLWLSNYQFAGIYRDKGNPAERPGLLIVNAPKAGPVTFINYEDICYSVGELRLPQFYLLHQPTWNVLIVASANSMEVGVMGLQEDQISWEQWTQEDAARAELPLLANKQETYPIGMALDTSSQHELPWGENQMLPPMPVLHLLSHEGLLCLFYTLNLRPDAPRICSPPESLSDQSGMSHFTTSSSYVAKVMPSSPAEQIIKSAVEQSSKPMMPVAPIAAEIGTQKLGFKVNLTPKFESIATAQPLGIATSAAPVSNMFGMSSGLATTVSPATSTVFGMSGMTKPPAPTGFGLFNLPNTNKPLHTLSFDFLTQTSIKPAVPASSAAPIFTSTPASTSSSSSLFSLPQVATTVIHPTSVQTSSTATRSPIVIPSQGQQSIVEATPVAPPPAKVEPQQSSAVSTQAFAAAIDEEMAHFERELNQLRNRVNTTNIQVGMHEEKVLLKQKVDTLEAFWRELKETTQAQTVEIHTLKSTLMEAFAWAEEAKSRAQQLSSPTYIQLVRSQGLDPVTSHHVGEIKHLVYYVENQLQQVNQQLDSRWTEFKESCKPSPKKKMHIPSLEAVYQTMVCQNNILNKQRAIMTDIARRAKQQGRTSDIPLISSAVLARVRDKEANHGETELSRLAESLVQIKLGSGEENRPVVQCRQLNLRKQAQLRNILTQRSVTRICATKPTIPPGGISGGRPIVKSPQASSLSRNGMVPQKANQVPKQAPPAQANGIVSASVYENVTPPGTPKSIAVDASGSVPSYSFTFTQPKTDTPLNTSMGFGSCLQKSPLMSLDSIVAGIGDSSNTSSKPVASSQMPVSKSTASMPFAFGSFTASQTAFGNTEGIKKPEDTFKFTSFSSQPSEKGVMSKENSAASPAMSFKLSFTAQQSQVSIFSSGIEKQKPPSIFTGAKTQTAASTFGDTTVKPVVETSSIKLPDFTAVAKPPEAVEAKEKPPSANEHTSLMADSSVNQSMSLFGNLSVAGSKESSGNMFGKTNKESSTPANIFASKESKPVQTIFDNASTTPNIFVSTINKTSPDSSTIIFGDNENKDPLSTTSTFDVDKSKEGGTTSGLFKVNLGKDSTAMRSIFGGNQNKDPALSVNIFGTNQSKESPSTGSNASAPEVKEAGTPATIFGTGLNKDSPSSDNLFARGQMKESISSASVHGGSQTKDATPNADVFSASQNKDSSGSFFGGAQSSLISPISTNLFVGGSTESSGGNNVFDENKSNVDKDATTPKIGLLGAPPESKTSSESGNLFGNSAASFLGSLGLNKTIALGESVQQEREKSTAAVKENSEVTDTPVSDQTTSAETATTVAVTIIAPVSVTTSTTTSADVEPKKVEETKTQASFFGGFSQMAQTLSSPASTPIINFSFGQSATAETPTKTSELSVFGGSTPTTTTVATTSAASAFTFTLPATTASTAFGQKPLFGQPATTSTPTTTSTSSTATGPTFFGQPVCSPSAFGQSGTGNAFAQASTAPPKTLFGQPVTTSTQSMFGASTPSQTTTTTSPFGQNVSTPAFGQVTTTGSAFGSTSGFDSKPTFGQSGGPLFGQSGGFGAGGRTMFGGSSGGSSIFGGSSGTGGPTSGNVFQSPPSSGLYGNSPSGSVGGTTGGAFSSGMGSISQTGFGSPTAFQNKPAGGFGGSPVFGSAGASSFGSPPTFGGAPTFGGSPTFGSPTKVFGSSSPTSNVGFGTTSQQSTTFENLATQNTMTFGNLAQNQNQQQPGFGSPPQSVFGGTPPSQPAFSSGSFGGSSFSSWR